MRFLILIIFYSTILLLPVRPKLNIKAEDNFFYQKHKEIVDSVIHLIQESCVPKKDIVLKIKFDYLPEQLVDLNPQQRGLTSVFSSETFVEVNPYYFDSAELGEMKNLLLHEMGHALGLHHKEEPQQVMNPETQENLIYQDFFRDVKKHCKDMEDVPREIDFLTNN